MIGGGGRVVQGQGVLRAYRSVIPDEPQLSILLDHHHSQTV